MNCLGLDMSLSATGVAYCDGSTTTWAPRTTGVYRLIELRDTLASILTAVVDLVVIENYAFGRPQQACHIGELGGIMRVAIHEAGVPFVEIPPASLKRYGAGKGNATKPDLRMALFQRAGVDLRDDNQVDAWWLRAMALDHYGEPVVAMPAVNREALTKIAWPILYTEGLTPPVAVRP